MVKRRRRHGDSRACVRQLRALFADQQVRRYAFVCEAWTIATNSMAEVQRWVGRIAEHQDRREILTIHAEDRDGRGLIGYYYILRPEHGPPKLSPLQMAEGGTGQLMGMLT